MLPPWPLGWRSPKESVTSGCRFFLTYATCVLSKLDLLLLQLQCAFANLSFSYLLLLAAAPPAAEGYCCKLLLLLLLLLQFLLLVLPLPCYQLIVFSSDLRAELQMPSNPYDQSLRTFEKHCRARANRCKSRFRKNIKKTLICSRNPP